MTFTRSTSGVNAVLLSVCAVTVGEAGVASVSGPVCFCSETGGTATGVCTAAVFGGGGIGSGGSEGIRHLPSAFWAQTISGLTSENSLMTRCPPKREEKRIRGRKGFAGRETGENPGGLFRHGFP